MLMQQAMICEEMDSTSQIQATATEGPSGIRGEEERSEEPSEVSIMQRFTKSRGDLPIIIMHLCRVVVTARPHVQSGVGEGCVHAVQQTKDAIRASVEMCENRVRTRSVQLNTNIIIHENT